MWILYVLVWFGLDWFPMFQNNTYTIEGSIDDLDMWKQTHFLGVGCRLGLHIKKKRHKEANYKYEDDFNKKTKSHNKNIGIQQGGDGVGL